MRITIKSNKSLNEVRGAKRDIYEVLYKMKLAQDAILLERKILKEKGGYQDQIAAAYGGINSITFYKKNFSVNKIKYNNKISQLESNLFLLYTGFKRISSNIQTSLEKNLNYKQNNIEELIFAAEEGKKIWSLGKCQTFSFFKCSQILLCSI